MIEYLTGTLIEAYDDMAEVVIETSGGVAYRCAINPAHFPADTDKGQKYKLFIHVKKTETEDRFFGFLTLEERWLFRKLLTVDRVGPVLAMRICALGSAKDVWQAIRLSNAAFLQRAKGCDKAANNIILALNK